MRAFERLLHGDLTLRQYFEVNAMEARHRLENRERARTNGRLVPTLELFSTEEKPMRWEEQGFHFAGFRTAYGYTPADVERECPSEQAYWCNSCDGWIKGSPAARDYNEIGFLSGSAGTRFFCGVCQDQIGESITEMS